MYKFVTKNS